MAHRAVTLTEETFEDALNGEPAPLLVDFWVSGCGPCIALAPILDDLATAYQGQLRVGTVKLDDAPALAARYQIMHLPTLIVFAGGQPAKRITGYRNRQQLMKELQEFLVADPVPAGLQRPMTPALVTTTQADDA